MKKIYFKVSMILLSLMLLSNRAMANGYKYIKKDGTIDSVHIDDKGPSSEYLGFLGPYTGVGIDVSRHFGVKSSPRVTSISLGWRVYSYAFGRRYTSESSFVPAYEVEYREIHLTNNKGEVVLNPMVNFNMYLSLYPQFNSIIQPTPYDYPHRDNNPLNFFDVYGTIGGGQGTYANDISIGGGVALLDLVQLEVKHTKFFGARTKGNTSVMVKFNIPAVLISGAPKVFRFFSIFLSGGLYGSGQFGAMQ